jgi:hypothetical protein
MLGYGTAKADPVVRQFCVNSAATFNVFPSSADLEAPLCSQSHAKPEYMGPQNCRNGQHPGAMIKDIRALLNTTQHATHCVAISSGTWELIKSKCHNKM